MTGASRRIAAAPARHRVADRGWLGGGLALAGAVLLFLGWYGVSGANTVPEQLPYLASGSIPGAALVIAAAVMWSRESAQRTARRTDALVAELHGLLVDDDAVEVPVTTADAPPPDGHYAVAGAERYHRAGCVLIAGKPDAALVDAAAIAARHLSPCDICEPTRPAV